MRGIIKEHGDAIIAFVVVIVILGILFCAKMMNDISEAGTTESSIDYMGYADTVKQVVSVAAPEICFEDASVIHKNMEIDLRTYFSVKYGTGECVQAETISKENFKVISIRNQSEEEFIGQYRTDTGKIIFPKEGIYTIELCVKDNDRRESRMMFQIPVEDIFEGNK